ncbi:MAG TPA: hypothetical protein VJ000_01205 [Thermodesulfovibrionia bacterium]|nr:MAG: hypothetical protein A2Z57_10885 [Planctomycetes bacterium RIFCSPHIGHO2_12_39_6]HLA49789.1 hypothetical protein [Thermodesulfovibrionia bacterium]
MISANNLVIEVLRIIKEPTDGTGQYTAANVIQILNLCQDEITSDIPDFLKTKDETLVTVASNASYTVPSTIGKVTSVWVNGVALKLTTEDTQSSENLRNDREDSWFNTSGTPKEAFIRNGNTLHLYPYAATAGQTITIIGELLLTQMTNSSGSTPFENAQFFRKAQRALIYLAASYLAIEDGNQKLVNNLEGKAAQIIRNIKNEWMVMRPSSPDSTLTEKFSEDFAA